MIDIQNLNITYKNSDIPSLSSIDLSITDSSIVLIVGESGSGKSTLANSIIGIQHQFKDNIFTGSIYFNGTNYDDLNVEVLNQNIGFLPQYPADYSLNSLVRDEITFQLENLGWSKNKIKSRLIEVSSDLRIEHLLFRVISELSSGELQKVGLAIALAPNPKILLLDEPFARIDSYSAVKLIELIQELKQKDMIIIMFDHHLDYLLEIADRLIILEKGKIISDDSVKNSYSSLSEKIMPEIMRINIPGHPKKEYKFEVVSLNLEDYLRKK